MIYYKKSLIIGLHLFLVTFVSLFASTLRATTIIDTLDDWSKITDRGGNVANATDNAAGFGDGGRITRSAVGNGPDYFLYLFTGLQYVKVTVFFNTGSEAISDLTFRVGGDVYNLYTFTAWTFTDTAIMSGTWTKRVYELSLPTGTNAINLTFPAGGASAINPQIGEVQLSDTVPTTPPPTTSVIYQSPAGNIGIGTTSPTELLTVNGAIHAKQVIVDNTIVATGTIRAKELLVNAVWADFVFDPNYNLRSLTEVEAQIKATKHLPDIPSAKSVSADGLSVGEMQSRLLQKVEELTLYIIELEKSNKALKARVESLERKQP